MSQCVSVWNLLSLRQDSEQTHSSLARSLSVCFPLFLSLTPGVCAHTHTHIHTNTHTHTHTHTHRLLGCKCVCVLPPWLRALHLPLSLTPQHRCLSAAMQSHSHTVTQSHRPVRLVLAVFVLWNKILSDTNHLNGMQLLIISSAEGGYVFTCVCLLVCLVKSCGKMIRSRNLISLFVKFVDGNFEWVPRGTVGPWWRWATFYLSLSIGGAASDEANQANV